MHKEFLSNLIIKKIHSITTFYSDSERCGKRINREKWALIIKYEGESFYNCKGNKYISNAENIVILPKSSSYEWKSVKAGHYSVIEFEIDYEYDEIISIKTEEGEKILKIMKELEYKRLMNSPLSVPECIKGTYDILLRLFKSQQKKYTPTEKLSKIQPAIDYIANNYHTNIKNEHLAKLTGLSCVYFRKLFTQYFSMSPITYIHSLRIRKAKEMLKSDYSSISDIAHSLGYINIYDFSRDFKKHTGMSPSAYAKE